MHTLVRRYIKTAVGFLVAGLVIGGWIIIQRELWHGALDPYKVSAHTHAIFVGFVMMMILGVALWLFPRPEKSNLRYHPVLVEIAYWIITIATGSRILGELLRSYVTAPWLHWAVVVSGLGQILALGLFFYTMWSRIRPAGSQSREAQGERF